VSHKRSEYMHWAKTQSKARYNLATSGVGPFPIAELPFVCAQLAINGDNSYGYLPLKRAIAERQGVDVDCVVTAEGTSMANYLAMAALLEPGDEVLVEHPAYGLLVDALLYIGAEVKRFDRTEESGYALDPDAVRRSLTPRTKLIVITNLHNPSSALAPEAVLREIADFGVRVLVDEVYLDAVFTNTPRSAFHLGPNVIVTSSLTKVYGLSGLRCGWILAQPDLARAMWQLNNVFAATPVHPGELLSVAAFQNLDRIRDRARRVLEADRASLREHLDAPPFGTTVFRRVPNGDQFAETLKAEHETSVVPGRFFDMPDHIRVGMGVDHEMFVEGIRRLRLLLEAP
jgi:aspartate/methionine/tyrosine aminotransferase